LELYQQKWVSHIDCALLKMFLDINAIENALTTILDN